MQRDRQDFKPFFGTPTEAQLAMIRDLQPVGSIPLEAEELFVASLVVCDNFMRRDGRHALSPSSLLAMKKALPGSTFTRDHDTRLSSKKQARFFDSRITITDEISEEFIARDGYAEENQQIYKAHGGYIQLWADIYVDAKSTLVRRLKFGRDAEISYHGSFMGARMICSDCSCSNPRGIYGEDCHMVESWFAGIPLEWFFTESEIEEIQISSFETIEAEGFDPWETSFVVVPAYSRSGTTINKEM